MRRSERNAETHAWGRLWKDYEQGRLTIASRLHAVDAQPCVLFLGLPGLDVSEGFDGAETGVLSQGHGNRVQGVSKGAHGVLLQTRAL